MDNIAGRRTSLPRVLVVVLFCVLLALVPRAVAPFDEQYPLLVVVGSLAALVGILVNTVLHEAGHAAAAAVVGLRVRAMYLFGRRVIGRGEVPDRIAANMVHVDLAPEVPRSAPRMVAFALGGPAANLAIAAPALILGAGDGYSDEVRCAALAWGLVGAFIGIANLLPFRNGSAHSDGVAAFRWAFGRAERPASGPVAAPDLNAGPDLAEPRDIAYAGAPAAAGPAAITILQAHLRLPPSRQVEATWADVPLFLRVGRLPGVDPQLVVRCCSLVAYGLAVQRLGEPEPEELKELVALAETGYRAAPKSPEAAYALAFVRGCEDRSAEGRALLVGLPLNDAKAETIARVHAVRALIEVDLDDVDQARRLVAVAQRHAPNDNVVRLARAQLEAR